MKNSRFIFFYKQAFGFLLLVLCSYTSNAQTNSADARSYIRNLVAKYETEVLSYHYTCYDKSILTPAAADWKQTQTLSDTILFSWKEWVRSRDFLVVESVSENDYHTKKGNNAVIKDAIVSGMTQNDLSVLPVYYRNFDVFQDPYLFAGKRFHSPLSSNYFDDYEYHIEKAEGDELVVSYKPKTGSTILGFQGRIYMKKSDAQLTRFEAKTEYEKAGFNARLLINMDPATDYLLPLYSRMEMYIHQFSINHSKPVALLESWYYDWEKQDEYNGYDDLRVSLAVENQGDLLKKYRDTKFKVQDLKSYVEVDSLASLRKLDEKLFALEETLFGRFPLGPIDINLDRLIDYNDFEGFRVGFGAHTNDNLLSWLSLGAYVASGTKDLKPKYGTDIKFFLDRKTELTIGAEHKNDVFEFGGVRSLVNPKQFGHQRFGNLTVRVKDRFILNELYLGIRPMANVKLKTSFASYRKTVTSDYRFKDSNSKTFQFTEAGLGMQWVLGADYLKSARRVHAVKPGKMILSAQVNQGIKLAGGDYNYFKWNVKLDYNKYLYRDLLSRLSFQFGAVDRSIPGTDLFNSLSNFDRSIHIAVSGRFETMRMNEYLFTEYAGLFHTLHFGKALFGYGTLAPELVLVNNLGWGHLKGASDHNGISIGELKDIYTETGLRFDNILPFTGIAFYYRYGANALEEKSDNFLVKLGFSFLF